MQFQIYGGKVSLLLIHIFATQNSQNDDKKEGEREKKETRRKDKQEKFGQCQSDSEEPCVCDKLGAQLCKGRGTRALHNNDLPMFIFDR